MKILKIIYNFLFAFLVLVALLLIVSVLPITGNIKFLTVQSGSMEPKIKMGSVIIIKPFQDYKVGEVITFGSYSRTKAPITHRIYDIKLVNGQPVYITKGDANNAPDLREVKQKDVLGRVLISVPYFGYLVDFAKKPLGFMMIIVIPAVLIIYDEAKKIIEELKKNQPGNINNT